MRKILTFLSIFFSLVVVGQREQLYKATNNGGLCGSSILLFDDGTYNLEWGCEASSHFSFGTWQENKDTIYFKAADPAQFGVIKKVSSSKTIDSTTLTVKVFDRNGSNITERVKLGLYVNRVGTYPMTLDSSGEQQTTYRRHDGVIVLTSLQRLFKQRLAILISDANVFEITLDLPSAWIYNINSDWDNTSEFKKTRIKNALRSVVHDDVETGTPKKRIYHLQEN